MVDIFTKTKRSAVMAAIRSVGNRSTELSLAVAFRRNGVKGWRRHTDISGKPDFAFFRAKVAIFVDGCFWHACPKHGHKSHSNRNYWDKKLEKNRLRDRKITGDLRKGGWLVIRFWEHEVKVRPDLCAQKVKILLSKIRG
jgi:DNA mismatch endonuclease (patch repair protein)